jgi:xylulose-5-phosphate/fructose-6-phosphate phosphoketolase
VPVPWVARHSGRAQDLLLSSFHLVMDVIDRVPQLGSRAAQLRQLMRDKRAEHRMYVRQYGQDLPEVREDMAA